MSNSLPQPVVFLIVGGSLVFIVIMCGVVSLIRREPYGSARDISIFTVAGILFVICGISFIAFYLAFKYDPPEDSKVWEYTDPDGWNAHEASCKECRGDDDDY